MKRGLFCLVSSRPKLHKGLWTIQTMRHGSLGQQCVWNFPKTRANVNYVLLLSLSPFSTGHTNWESCHTKQGHHPTASSIDWLGCHSNRSGRSCLWTLQVPGDVSSMWHHNQVFSDSSESRSPPGKAPHLTQTSHFGATTGKIFWSEDGSFLYFPFSPFQGSTEMTFLSCSIQL
jgi:hypothetical protein